MAVWPSAKGISFGPYTLHAENALLLREGAPVAITPRALDVLHYLAARPGRLVTKEELLGAVWADVLVSDASIKVCVREIRKTLEDDANSPTYIETVHRRGYRFIAPVRELESEERAAAATPVAPIVPIASEPVTVAAVSRNPFVGRESQLKQLRDAFEQAASGRRQCVLISGGPGSGKTALVEAFARSLEEGGVAPLVLYGHCFEQFGAGEPYMPVWEAMGRVARQTGSPHALLLLARHAAVHGAAASASAADATGRPSTPISPQSDRMLREISEAIESMAAEAPIVVVLEDIQWADHSTVDLISALAGRYGAAKLLLIATFRPHEMSSRTDHPLRGVIGRLLSAGRCREMALDDLEESAVKEFLELRFPGGEFPPELARRLHERTSGCPLFLIHLVDDLIEQGVLNEQGGAWNLAGHEEAARGEIPGWLAVLDTLIPRNLRSMIEAHVERLEPGIRAFLEVAAVAGVEFSAAAVAAAAETDVVQAERACEELARRHRFLEQSGHDEWPDGVVGTHYRFAHELYHNVVYEQVPIARRVRLHQLVGLRIESAWGSRAGDEAANLAMHFEMARDWPRAVSYLRSAAQAAARQFAYREAVHYLRRALSAVERLPAAQREDDELELLSALSVNLQVTRGFAAPEVEALHARAHALCLSRRDVSDVARTFPVVWGIWLFHKVRSDLRQASEMCDELLSLARNEPAMMVQAHQAVCVTNLCAGNPRITCQHMERAAAIYDPIRHRRNAEVFGQDPGVATLAFGAVALWIMGREQDALQVSEQSLALARRLAQPSSVALAMHFAAMLHQCRGDAEQSAHWSQRAIDLSDEEGFSFWRAGGQILRGWARAVRAGEGFKADALAGLDEIRHGLEAWLATGSRTYHTYYLGLLADALQRAGRAAEAQGPIDDALAAARTLSEGLYEAELHRLKGRGIVLMAPEDPCPPGAQMCFVKATTVARLQGAVAFEERASADLAALLVRQAQHRNPIGVGGIGPQNSSGDGIGRPTILSQV